MMRLIAIKLTDDIDSIKVIYEKQGSMFLRNGSDSFQTGIKVGNIDIFYKFGFKKIVNPPVCSNKFDIQGAVTKMEVMQNGTVKYLG